MNDILSQGFNELAEPSFTEALVDFLTNNHKVLERVSVPADRLYTGIDHKATSKILKELANK